jgi:predicted transcriptional regulator
MPKTYVKCVSYRLDPELKDKLDRLARQNRRTATAQLEMLIAEAPEPTG